ncbi:unnamed protein product, partial [Prorocentrum cordatum]
AGREVMGTLFGATDEACLLAAVVAAPRRIFVCPPGKKKESLACVRGFCPTSDTLAAYAACKAAQGVDGLGPWFPRLHGGLRGLEGGPLRGVLRSLGWGPVPGPEAPEAVPTPPAAHAQSRP